MGRLYLLFASVGVVLLTGIVNQLRNLRKENKKIMQSQQQLNEKVAAINTGLDTLRDTIIAEAEQIRRAIERADDVDLSALDGVVTRLTDLGQSVNDMVIEPIEPETPPIGGEPTGGEPTGGEAAPIGGEPTGGEPTGGEPETVPGTEGQ